METMLFNLPTRPSDFLGICTDSSLDFWTLIKSKYSLEAQLNYLHSFHIYCQFRVQLGVICSHESAERLGVS